MTKNMIEKLTSASVVAGVTGIIVTLGVSFIVIQAENSELRLSNQISTLQANTMANFKELNSRIDSLNTKFDAKFDVLNSRIESQDTKFEAKIEVLDGKIDNQNTKP